MIAGLLLALLIAGCEKSPVAAAGDSATSAASLAAAASTAPAPAPATAPTNVGSQIDSPAPNAPEIAALDAVFDPRRDPAANLRLATAEAKRSGRRITFDVGGEWCGWCHAMQGVFERDPALMRLRADRCVWMEGNDEEDHENAAFLSRYPKIEGYAQRLGLDADGTLLHSQDSDDLGRGKGYDAASLATFLRQWAPARS